MAVDVTIQPIPSGYNITKINNNFIAIQNALDDAVSLSGGLPNAMGADLDLNGHDLLNASSIRSNILYVGGVQFFPGSVSAQGDKGWSPAYAIVVDGSRRVFQLVDYVGGAGTKPTSNIGQYVTSTGYSAVIANGADIRGPTGAGTGDLLAANNGSEFTNFATLRSNIGLGSVNNTADSAKPVSTAQTAAILLAQRTLTTGRTITSSDTGVLTDAGGYVRYNSASAGTFTINTGIFPQWAYINFVQVGAGALTITAGAGVTINFNKKTSGVGAAGSIIHLGSEVYDVVGSVTT